MSKKNVLDGVGVDREEREMDDVPFLGLQSPSKSDWSHIHSTLKAFSAEVSVRKEKTKEAKAEAKYINAHAELNKDVLDIFIEEGDDLLVALDGFYKSTAKKSTLSKTECEQVKRHLHTFKGIVGMVQANAMGDLIHVMESDIEDVESDKDLWKVKRDTFAKQLHDLQEWMAWVKDPARPPMLEFVQETRGWALQEVVIQEKTKTEESAEASAANTEKTLPLFARQASVRIKADVMEALLTELASAGHAHTALKTQNTQLKTLLRDLEEGVFRMQRLLKEVEVSAESQISARRQEMLSGGEEFDPLEVDRFTRLQESTKIMAEGVDDLNSLFASISFNAKTTEDVLIQQHRGMKTTQEIVEGARLVQASEIEGRLKRVVAVAAKDTKKKATFELIGGDLKLDKNVLERLTPSLEHILRNSVAHGIEDRLTRKKAGKPDEGRLQVTFQDQENGLILVTCSDDGKGLDEAGIKEKAIEKGFIAKDAATVTEWASLIFKPGFSTASKVTQLAGRGVGMDVVKTDVEQMGGQVQVVSSAGVGMTTLLEVPTKIATTHVVVVKALGDDWALPAPQVVRVHSVRGKDIEKAQKTGLLEGVPLEYLPNLLSASSVLMKVEKYNTVIELAQGSKSLMVLVDELTGSEEVVIRQLNKPLNKMKGFSGAAYLGEGRVGLLVQPLVLWEKKEATKHVEVKKSVEHVKKMLTAMVVDDSLTVRKVTGDFLKRHGMNVVLAKHGEHALELIQNQIPDIFLLDLEMPRMNGFELLERIRGDAELKHIPVIMITSRTAEKHQEKAQALGVDAYLGKPYKEVELLAEINRLTTRKQSASAGLGGLAV